MSLHVQKSPNFFQTDVESMQVDTPPDENAATQQKAYTAENPTLDLEAYASSYNGFAKLSRLMYIADHCPSLKIEALEMALSYVQTTCNITQYKIIHQELVEAVRNTNLPDITHGFNASIIPLDTVWMETQRKKAALKWEKLNNELKHYEHSSIREGKRRGHDDLGDHFLDCGDLANAFMCYCRARDYCTSRKHVVDMCFKMIKVNVYMQKWSHVLTYAHKAELTSEIEHKAKEESLSILTKLKCAIGLAKLATGKYKSATEDFLQASFVHYNFPELLSPNDVALYVGLLALAFFDRQELLEKVISSSSFKLFLELEPQLRDIIFHFYESRYSSCLKMLDEMKDNLLLDMYLAPHVNTLYTQIRNRALMQYFSPYLSVDMNKMAQSFNTTVKDLENELIVLILDNHIQARIDSHSKILYAKDIDQRISIYEKALQMGKEYRRRTTQLILRYAIIRNRLEEKENEMSFYQINEMLEKRKFIQSCLNQAKYFDSCKEAESSSPTIAEKMHVLMQLNLDI